MSASRPMFVLANAALADAALPPSIQPGPVSLA